MERRTQWKAAVLLFFKERGTTFLRRPLCGRIFATLTTAAGGELVKIHDRRPVAFGVDRGREWIEQLPQSEGSVVARAIPPEEIIFHPVGTAVSSPRNDGPELIQPVEVKEGARQEDLI